MLCPCGTIGNTFASRSTRKSITTTPGVSHASPIARSASSAVSTVTPFTPYASANFAKSGPLSGPDFAKLAEAYGVRGVTVEDFDQAKNAIDDAWETPGIVVIDFRVEREANVFPIVPQGQSIGDMLIDPTTKAQHHEPAGAPR